MDLTEDVKLLHTTSDILDINTNNFEILLLLGGDRDLLGEMVLEGSGLNKISKLQINGKEHFYTTTDGKLLVRYQHPHRNYIEISITLSNGNLQ